MSLFGSTTQPAGASSLFPSTPTTSTPATTPGIFGSAPSGVIGTSGGSWLSGTVASASASAAAPASAAPAPFAGSSLFGGPQSGAATSGPAPAAGGTTASPFPFPSQTAQSAPPASNPAQAFGAPATSSSGLFGSSTTSAAAPSSGLFGSKPATSGGLFSSSAAAPSSAPAFGASTTTGSGLFGGSTAAQGAMHGGGAFSSAPVPNPFGQSQNQAQPFGQSTALGASTMGYQPGSLASSTMVGASRRPEPTVQEKLMIVKNSWDRNSPLCRFQYFFYNVVPPEQVGLYARPQLAQNEVVWQAAVRGNPQPERMVPALAMGFSDLKKRVDAQESQAAAHVAKLQELSTALSKVSRKHSLETTARLQKLSSTQTHLSARLCSLISKLHPLTAARGSPIRAEDEDLARRLADLKAGIEGKSRNRGGGEGIRGGKARIGELWALVGQKKAVLEGGRRDEAGWAVSDETEMAKVLEALMTQQRGLDHLSRTLRRAQADMALMRKEFGLPP